MALAIYQEIFCQIVASAIFRQHLRERPDEMLEGLDLTERERRRLLSLAEQPGMRVNTAIHRANRLSPVNQSLPFTCFLLAEQLGLVLERYWSANPAENLQVLAECERFAAFLDTEIHAGRVTGRYLEEILAFERACAQLRFLAAEELRQRASLYYGASPLIRIITFHHNPEILLGALERLEVPAPNIETGEFYLLVDCRSEEPDFRLLDADGLAAIRQLQKETAPAG